MDQIVNRLAEHTGIDTETAHKAVGAVVAFLQTHLPDHLSSRMMEVLPGSEHAVARYQSAAETEGGGLMGTVASLAGAVLGGSKAGESSKLMEMLAKSGLDLGQVRAFLPKALAILKDHVPPEIYEKIKDIGGVGPEAEKADKV